MVGAGPSGLSAALAARRAGADVLLCERYGCFGGVITTVGMETIGWYRYEGCMNDSEVLLIQIVLISNIVRPHLIFISSILIKRSFSRIQVS